MEKSKRKHRIQVQGLAGYHVPLLEDSMTPPSFCQKTSVSTDRQSAFASYIKKNFLLYYSNILPVSN